MAVSLSAHNTPRIEGEGQELDPIWNARINSPSDAKRDRQPREGEAGLERSEGGKPPISPGRNPIPGEDQRGLAKNRLAQWLAAVNANSVSKVVDENGEPLRRWHGGRKFEFDRFLEDPAMVGDDAIADPDAAQVNVDP